ncbi:MAG: regulatory protein RecX [Actinomycetota bacterium]
MKVQEEELPAEAAYDRALDRALRLLGERARSRFEVRERLRRAGFSDGIVERVDARLVELDILDDAAFARDWLDLAVGARGRALRAARRDLEERGVARETIEKALEEFEDQHQIAEAERALLIARRRAGTYVSLSPPQAFQRLAGFLARRGYEEELVLEVCRAVVGDPESS